LEIVPGQIAQKHVDRNYDQFFILLRGQFNITYQDVNTGLERIDIIEPGDFIYLNKGTTFQFKDIAGQGASMIGGFLPGERTQLLRDLGEEFLHKHKVYNYLQIHY